MHMLANRHQTSILYNGCRRSNHRTNCYERDIIKYYKLLHLFIYRFKSHKSAHNQLSFVRIVYAYWDLCKNANQRNKRCENRNCWRDECVWDILWS